MAISKETIQTIQQDYVAGNKKLKDLLRDHSISPSTFYRAARSHGFHTVDYTVVLSSGLSKPYSMFVGGSRPNNISSWKNGPDTKSGKIYRVHIDANDNVNISLTAPSNKTSDTLKLTLKWGSKKINETWYHSNGQVAESNGTYKFT